MSASQVNMVVNLPEQLKNRGKAVSLRIPGSASNLGPGFDCIGLALSIYCRLTFVLMEEPDPNIPLVSFAGAIAGASMPQDMGNLTYQILSRLWSDNKRMLERVRIHVDSDIPLGCGLGSSAAAVLGALWADHVFKDRIPTTGSLLKQATELIGHSETLAASLMGRCVVTAPSFSNSQVVARQHEWPESWAVLVLVPTYRLATKAARAALPKSVQFSDAVWNAQRSALLVSAIVSADESTMKEALHDRLAEPYRESLVPELVPLRRFLVNEPVLGTVLSGGGPSMLVFANRRDKEVVRAKLQEFANAQPKAMHVLDLLVDDEGIREQIG